MIRLFITVLGSLLTGISATFTYDAFADGKVRDGLQFLFLLLISALTVIQNLKTLQEKEARGERP